MSFWRFETFKYTNFICTLFEMKSHRHNCIFDIKKHTHILNGSVTLNASHYNDFDRNFVVFRFFATFSLLRLLFFCPNISFNAETMISSTFFSGLNFIVHMYERYFKLVCLCVNRCQNKITIGFFHFIHSVPHIKQCAPTKVETRWNQISISCWSDTT